MRQEKSLCPDGSGTLQPSKTRRDGGDAATAATATVPRPFFGKRSAESRVSILRDMPPLLAAPATVSDWQPRYARQTCSSPRTNNTDIYMSAPRVMPGRLNGDCRATRSAIPLYVERGGRIIRAAPTDTNGLPPRAMSGCSLPRCRFRIP